MTNYDQLRPTTTNYDQLRPTTAILTLYVSLLGLGVDVVRLFPWCSLLSAPALVASVGIQ